MSADFQEAEQIECFTQDNIWKMSGIYVHKHQDVGQAQEMIPTEREWDLALLQWKQPVSSKRWLCSLLLALNSCWALYSVP